MKMTVLGGSAAGGNRGAGCAGFLFQDGNTSLVIDLGPGTMLELRKHVDYRALSAIVISHYHLDHILDLGALNYLLRYNPAGPADKLDVWIPPGTRERFASWTAAFGNEGEGGFLDKAFNVQEYDPSSELRCGTLALTFAPTVHPVSAWAMRISAGTGRDIGYTADTGPAAELIEFLSGVALLIAEATESETEAADASTRGHLTPHEAGVLAEESRASLLMLSHIWDENDIDLAAREACQSFGRPVLVGRPGLCVTL